MMANLSQMTMDELRTLETERYGRYADWYHYVEIYDNYGMDAAIWDDLAEVRNEIERRRERERICALADRTNLEA
jgi:hypothetical protein